MVRHIKDPGIDMPGRGNRELPQSPILGNLAELDARAKRSRVSKGITVGMSIQIAVEEKTALEGWAKETGKSASKLLRELIRAALICRSKGRSVLAVLENG